MMLTISQWSLQKIVYPDHMLHFSKSHQEYLFQTCLREGTHEIPEIKRQAFTVHKVFKQTLQKDKFFHTWWWAGAILSVLIGHPEPLIKQTLLICWQQALLFPKDKGRRKFGAQSFPSFLFRRKNCLGFQHPSNVSSIKYSNIILLVIADSWKSKPTVVLSHIITHVKLSHSNVHFEKFRHISYFIFSPRSWTRRTSCMLDKCSITELNP